MSNLTVLHNDNGTYVDYSQQLADYGRDTQEITYVALEDELLIGFYKPFINPYIDITATDNAGITSVAYYDGTSFNSLDLFDRTNDLTRSGFLEYSAPDDWAALEIDNRSLYWIKITYAADHITTYNGINTIFSDDDNLREEYRLIDEFKIGSDQNFVLAHQSVRKDIVQYLRNAGNYKMPLNSKHIKDIDQWDLLEPHQIKRAATYWALAKIFNNASDQVDDKFQQLSMMYRDKGKNALEVYLLTLDVDDDGKKENKHETYPIRTGTITRL